MQRILIAISVVTIAATTGCTSSERVGSKGQFQTQSLLNRPLYAITDATKRKPLEEVMVLVNTPTLAEAVSETVPGTVSGG